MCFSWNKNCKDTPLPKKLKLNTFLLIIVEVKTSGGKTRRYRGMVTSIYEDEIVNFTSYSFYGFDIDKDRGEIGTGGCIMTSEDGNDVTYWTEVVIPV